MTLAHSAKKLYFLQKVEISEVCKRVHCVDLEESFQTHICLQKLASIQPRTSPLKFAASRGDEVLTPEESCAAKCALQPKRLNLLGIKVRPLASSRMEVPPTMIDRAN